MTEARFATITVRIWRALQAYEKARAAYNEQPNFVCRQQRLKKAAIRLNRATLNATAALLPETKHIELPHDPMAALLSRNSAGGKR